MFGFPSALGEPCFLEWEVGGDRETEQGQEIQVGWILF